MLTLELPGPEATRRLGLVLAALLEPPALVTLCGELGTGKTTLVRHLVRARGVCDVVPSPSFTLAQSYQDRHGRPIHHLDLYRLSPGIDADLFAWDDYLSSDAVTLIEWPEAGADDLPHPDVAITLEHRSPTARAARIAAAAEVERRLALGLLEAGLEPKEVTPPDCDGRHG